MRVSKQFDAKYIDKEFEKIGARVKALVSVYLIGGCAMSFRGLKESTKDIDLVFKNTRDCRLFCYALFGAQYYEHHAIKPEHKGLKATVMYENRDGLHLDLFVGRVMKKLALSSSMIKRAELHKVYKNLKVFLLSPTDVFLFKGLASEERKRDLPDMQVLYPLVDWNVLVRELKSQKLAGQLIAWLVRRLEEFRQTYKLDVPVSRIMKL
jgi:hypothetical protein